MRYKQLSILTLFIFLIGCSSTGVRVMLEPELDKKPDWEIMKLSMSSGLHLFMPDLSITKIDDRKINEASTKDVIYLPPGQHVVHFENNLGSGELIINGIPGGHYEIDYKIISSKEVKPFLLRSETHYEVQLYTQLARVNQPDKTITERTRDKTSYIYFLWPLCSFENESKCRPERIEDLHIATEYWPNEADIQLLLALSYECLGQKMMVEKHKKIAYTMAKKTIDAAFKESWQRLTCNR